jgi:hypothetical protein
VPAPVGKPLKSRPKLRRFAAPAGLAAIAIGIVAGVMLRRTDAPPPVSEPPQPSAGAATAPAPVEPTTPAPRTLPPIPGPAETAAAPKTAPPPRANGKTQSTSDTQSTRDRLALEDGIARRVTPNIPQKSRNTITGKPAVVVRVTVNPAGDVDAAWARLLAAFSKFAVDAAPARKFIPEDRASPRHWMHFSSRTKTQVVALSRNLALSMGSAGIERTNAMNGSHESSLLL